MLDRSASLAAGILASRAMSRLQCCAEEWPPCGAVVQRLEAMASLAIEAGTGNSRSAMELLASSSDEPVSIYAVERAFDVVRNWIRRGTGVGAGDIAMIAGILSGQPETWVEEIGVPLHVRDGGISALDQAVANLNGDGLGMLRAAPVIGDVWSKEPFRVRRINGLVARIVCNLPHFQDSGVQAPVLPLSLGILDMPLVSVSTLERYRAGDPDSWADHYLVCLEKGATASLALVSALRNVVQQSAVAVRRSDAAAKRLLVDTVVDPVWTTGRVRSQYGVSDVAAGRALRSLEEHGVLHQIGEGRTRTWVAPAVLALYDRVLQWGLIGVTADALLDGLPQVVVANKATPRRRRRNMPGGLRRARLAEVDSMASQDSGSIGEHPATSQPDEGVQSRESQADLARLLAFPGLEEKADRSHVTHLGE